MAKTSDELGTLKPVNSTDYEGKINFPNGTVKVYMRPARPIDPVRGAATIYHLISVRDRVVIGMLSLARRNNGLYGKAIDDTNLWAGWYFSNGVRWVKVFKHKSSLGNIVPFVAKAPITREK